MPEAPTGPDIPSGLRSYWSFLLFRIARGPLLDVAHRGATFPSPLLYPGPGPGPLPVERHYGWSASSTLLRYWLKGTREPCGGSTQLLSTPCCSMFVNLQVHETTRQLHVFNEAVTMFCPCKHETSTVPTNSSMLMWDNSVHLERPSLRLKQAPGTRGCRAAPMTGTCRGSGEHDKIGNPSNNPTHAVRDQRQRSTTVDRVQLL